MTYRARMFVSHIGSTIKFIFAVAWIVLFLLLISVHSSKADAATLNVVAGTDAINDNDQCQLSEAIQNINDQAQTNNDCPVGDGNNDTINLPAGTITLSGDMVNVSRSVIIKGIGLDNTIISGNSQFSTFRVDDGLLKLSDMTITAFKDDGIQATQSSNLNVERVVIDGSGSIEGDDINGIGFYSPAALSTRSLILKDIVVKEITPQNGSATGISINSSDNATIQVNVQNVTVKSIVSAGQDSAASGFAMATTSQNFNPGNINAEIMNLTIDEVVSAGGIGSGIAAFAAVNGGTSEINIEVSNVSILNVSGQPSQFYGGERGAPITLGGVATQPQDIAIVNYSMSNTILSANSEVTNCIKRDLGSVFQAQGAATFNFTSLGGNISDDNSCADLFNQPTDLNNQANLKEYFEPLSDNGGSVPTIELLPGNPAIDGGVCEGAPTTDARNISRPQGSSCDSGAFEVQQDSTTKTVADKTVSLEVPNGMVVNNFTKIDQPVSDSSEFSYPLGMMSFNLGVPAGSTQEVSLVYETDLSPEQVVARKLDTSNNTYSTLSTAQITKTTKNGNPALKVTYSIKDGEYPDLDKTANGIIVDPVGLATTSTLVNTGIVAATAVIIGFILIAIASYTYIDYKRHKKPLISIEPELAKQYTYTHHLRVVTIPLFKYRLSIKLEKKPKNVGENA
jgi:hypothetical protein